jgi:hypothetical protein
VVVVKKKLLAVEIKVSKSGKTDVRIMAVVNKIGDTESAEVFQFILSKNDTIVHKEDYISSRFELIKLKVLDELKTIIDTFNPGETSLEILEDSHDLFKKVTMCCPDCGRKFFEAWGKTKGVVTKCRRCRALRIPVIRK